MSIYRSKLEFFLTAYEHWQYIQASIEKEKSHKFGLLLSHLRETDC